MSRRGDRSGNRRGAGRARRLRRPPRGTARRRLARRPAHDDEAVVARDGEPAAAERLADASQSASQYRRRGNVKDLLDAQRKAFAERPPGYAARIDALRRLEAALLKRENDIVAAISRDFGGRSAEETRSLELFPLILEIRHARRNLGRWMKPARAPVAWPFWPARAAIHYRPLGVVGIVSPWNYPFYL